MAQVEMIIGARGPRSERLESMRASADARASAPIGIEVRGTAYASAHKGYRVQITAPADVVDPYTGRRQQGKPIVAQFRDWHYVNDAKDPAVRRMVDEALQSNPRYGLRLDFWLVEAQRQAVQDKRLADARDTLRKLPKEVVMEFLAGLETGTDEDHALPKFEAKKSA